MLSLVIGFSVFKVVAHKNSKCISLKGQKRSTFDSSNPDPDSDRPPIPSKLGIWNDDFKRAANNYEVHFEILFFFFYVSIEEMEHNGPRFHDRVKI